MFYFSGICSDHPIHLEGLDIQPYSLVPKEPANPTPLSFTSSNKAKSKHDRKSTIPLETSETGITEAIHNYRLDFGVVPVGEER